jgi:DNA-binding NtrC family response regulator
MGVGVALAEGAHVRSDSQSSPSFDTPPPPAIDLLIGTSENMQEVRRLIEQACERRCDVLVSGEPGTGKELAAYAIHTRCQGSDFIRVECASPPGVLDSKLFGSKRPGSTLYLHEVGELPAKVQRHLSMALAERDASASSGLANVRVIASTSKSFAQSSAAIELDPELMQRLSALTIRLVPLSARREDIPLLLEHFLRELKRELGHPVEAFSPPALEILSRRTWVGNVSELYAYVRTTIALSTATVIEPLDLWLPQSAPHGTAEPWHLGYRELRKRVLLRFEADFVARVLQASRGNVSLAARLAKIDRKHLWRLIQRTGVRLERLVK